MRIIIGIDPGSGSSSACGLVAYNDETLDIVMAKALWPLKYNLPTVHRLKDIVEQVASLLENFFNSSKCLVGIESFVMAGKGGQTLQRLIGAILTDVPFNVKIIEIQNTKMKKWVGKHGGADKSEVAQGVLEFFESNEKSADQIRMLIKAQEFDILDAFGIAIAAQRGELQRGA